MKIRPKINTKNAILGILMHGPAHGYRIKKLFVPFIAKDGLNDGQLYPLLNMLEKEELVQKEVVHQRKSPSKNIYSITGKGREEFLQWLAGPDDELTAIKYDFFMQYSFLLKCTFLEHLPKHAQVAKLRRQIEAAREKAAEYRLMRQEMLERGLNAYKLKIVDFGIELQQLKTKWNQEMLDLELKQDTRRKPRTPFESNGSSTAKAIKPVASRARRPRKKD